MRSWFLQLILGASAAWAFWEDKKGWKEFSDGRDLQHFVTRPEFKAPRYMVAKHHPESITPGYWFVTPYTRLGRVPSIEEQDYSPCINGPHIYDGDGELVWSGACLYDNRIVFDLRPISINDTFFLTFILPALHDRDDIPEHERKPSGVLMNNQYEEISRQGATEGLLVDGHEFTMLPGGSSILYATHDRAWSDASSIGQKGGRDTINTGFQEKRLGIREPTFSWDPLSYGVLLNESCDVMNMEEPDPDGKPWDFFHINSIDKFANGDYLVSSRHTSTLYRVSRDDGHIIWRLGGCYNNSDFVMEDGVPFYWQHHSRIRFENGKDIIISLFDNASEDEDRGKHPGQDPPVGKILVLDTESKPMTAKMLRRFDRPDGGQSPALGSLSILGEHVETANVFIDWAFEGYVSEYDGDNRLVMEARFLTDRKKTYRAYKHPFRGEPAEPPILKVLPIGYSQDEAASAFYVSWNGATEVAFWTFYGGNNDAGELFNQLATVKRRGFETSWVTPGVVQYAYAEACDIDGLVLGQSDVTSITPKVHSRYEIAYPALQSLNVTAATPQRSRLEILEEVSSASARRHKDGLRNRSSYLVIEVFAAFGLYSAIRTLAPTFIRQRKGYRTTPAFAEFG